MDHMGEKGLRAIGGEDCELHVEPRLIVTVEKRAFQTETLV